MAQEEAQSRSFEFHIAPQQRGDFLRKVQEVVGSNPYILKEWMEGSELILLVIPASLTPGTLQQLTDLASKVDIHPVKTGEADKETEF